MNPNANQCPLCGQDNRCAVAKAEQTEKVDCWCMSVDIPADLLDQIPAKDRRRSCICQACLSKHQK